MNILVLILPFIAVFVLAIFLGFELISKVPPTLHTPLMSGSNAISGISIVGALLTTGENQNTLFSLAGTDFTITTIMGLLALIFATINVVGGFLVTNRMLSMFTKR